MIWRTASRAFHKTAAFPLEGKHLAVPCASCHLKGVLKGTPTGCYDCHWIRKPDDRFKTKLGTDCQTCHRPTAWTAVTWSHAAATGFTLETPHKTLDCESCHKSQVFKGTPRDCYSCHRADYERVQNPSHTAAGFPTDCTGCHKPVRALVAGRDLHARDVPPRGRPHDAGLRGLPQEQRVQGHAPRLLLLPPDRLPELEEPAARFGRLPDGLRDLPQVLGSELAGRRASTTT